MTLAIVMAASLSLLAFWVIPEAIKDLQDTDNF